MRDKSRATLFCLNSSRVWSEKSDLTRRLSLYLLMLFVLTAFLHIKEVHVGIPEVGKKAEHYVIAEVDFSYPDLEITAKRREQAVRDIDAIYRINPKQIDAVFQKVEEQFTQNTTWRLEYPYISFEQIFARIKLIAEKLHAVRLSNQKTLDKLLQIGAPLNSLANPLHSYNFFIDEDPSSLEQELSDPIWNSIAHALYSEGQNNYRLDALLLAPFSSSIWQLEQDVRSEKQVRRQIQEFVPETHSFIRAGSRVLDQGEIITPTHVNMLLSMKEALEKQRNLLDPSHILGSFLLAFLFTTLSVFFLKVYHPEVAENLGKLTFIIAIVLISLIMAKTVEYCFHTFPNAYSKFLSYPLFVPLASLLISLLIHPRVSLFVTGMLSVVMALSLGFEENFLIINLVAGMVTVMASRNLHRRMEIFTVCAKVWLVSAIVVFGVGLTSGTAFSVLTGASLLSIGLFMIGTAILVIGALPLFESLFKILTDLSLMEYIDPNHPLLRRLSLEAPGTYQHCLVVGNLAESAAQAINASGLFCRVSTLYHDIGKLVNPHYFTENQFGGFNIHQLLTPAESAQVIMSHISDGVNLARKYRLPEPFIDVIRQHHGTTRVGCFYARELEKMGLDMTKVDDKLFRYTGPKPRSKESAIIMIADTIEAASRSLDEINEQTLSVLVDRLVQDKAEDGQFDDCQLTFEELGIVKRCMVRTLIVTRHLRVKYPTLKVHSREAKVLV